MSWLYSLVLAGLMFSSDSNLPVSTNSGYTESNTKKVIKLDETERFDQTYQLNPNGRVSVSNVNGSITIDTWDNSQVKLEVVKTADDKERLAEVEIKIDAKPEYLRIETDYDNWRRENDSRVWRNSGKLQVEYRLTVPRNAVLDEIETVNGSVRISNATNRVKASAVNGEVRATNLRGATFLESVNGTVAADFDQLQTGSRVSLETVNGTVSVMIPSDANATVKADSLNGTITNDFGLPVRKGQYVGRDLYGRIGTGDVQIKLSSVNGGLSIKRKADGKNPKPAVDLLNQKSADDDSDDNDKDDDEDMDVDDDSSMKAMVKSQKDAVKAVKNAQKEIKKIKPEIEKIKPEIEKATSDAISRSMVTAPTIVTGVNTAVTTALNNEVNLQINDAIAKQKDAKAKLANINWNFSSPVVEKKSGSYNIKGTPLVTVDAQNCAVSVHGWDKPEVSYSLVRISRNNQRPVNNDSMVSVKNSDSEVNIKVTEEDTSNSMGLNEATKVRLEVYVPKKSNLKIVTNREIRLDGVSGDINLQGEDEAINVRDVDGKLSAVTGDGRIRVIGFRGAFDGKTNDGMMNLEGEFQKINAQTNEGAIVLTLPDNTNATIESNRKDIQAEGLSLVYIGDKKDISTWKVGSGGSNYRLYTASDGEVFIRNSKVLNAGLN